MTTTVVIKAHCDPEKKEVNVRITDGEAGNSIAEEFTMQDGEESERYVYDDRKIIIKEVEK